MDDEKRRMYERESRKAFGWFLIYAVALPVICFWLVFRTFTPHGELQSDAATVLATLGFGIFWWRQR